MNAYHPIIIRSDHKLLKYFKLLQILNQRQACCQHILAHYKFKIEYKKSDLNHIADMLIYNPGHKFDKNKLNNFNNIIFLLEFCFHADKTPVSLKDRIIDAQNSDYFCQKKFLRIEQATSLSKLGFFTLSNNTLYYKIQSRFQLSY